MLAVRFIATIALALGERSTGMMDGAVGRAGESEWRRRAAIALALASFLIYGATVFALPQIRSGFYCCEQSSLAAAVSNVVYGSRLGELYTGLFDYFIQHIDEPLEETLHHLPGLGGGHPTPPPGHLMKTTEDGNGIGYLVVVTAGFRVFGVHAWALPLAMLTLMGLSAVLFLWRFGGVLATIVTLYFTVLTVMLFSPLLANPGYAMQIHVSGIRYFSLVTVLPAFHILLDTLEPPPAQRRQSIMLALQVVILLMAILVRGSMIGLIAAIAVVALVTAGRHWGDRNRLQSLRRKAAVMGLTTLGLAAILALSVPSDYLKEGRFGTVIWHRITLSLGIDETFPYPGVREMFPCEKYIPEGILIGTPDRNGHCIWLAYVIDHHIPIESIGDQTYGGRYETALREAFFRIAWRYPGRVLRTFLIVKPEYIVWSIGTSFAFDFSGFASLTMGLLIASLVVLLLGAGAAGPPLSRLPRVSGVALLCTACTLPPLIAVWAMPHTSADLFFYCIFFPGLAFCAIPQVVQAALRRRMEAQAPG
jgi:hypothetical protein